jgi:hypothetical protein
VVCGYKIVWRMRIGPLRRADGDRSGRAARTAGGETSLTRMRFALALRQACETPQFLAMEVTVKPLILNMSPSARVDVARLPTMPLLCTMLLCAVLAGCGHARKGIPVDLMAKAEVVGFPGVRGWSDHAGPIQASLAESIRQAKHDALAGATGETDTPSILSISGGGANGAFGAGLLCGWSEAGTRPRFRLVTGISTGALMAPFVFLGPDYDPVLKNFYTTITTKDVLRRRLIVQMLLGADSAADSAPLERLLERCISQKLLSEVAREHKAGRRLFIGTTHLDAARLVVWDMGAIAASGRPDALALFRKVMLASASIPVAFPPQYFQVEADGEVYDEMHVDGGVMTEMFLYGVAIDIEALKRDFGSDVFTGWRLYVIRNGQTLRPARSVEPNLLAIAERALPSFLDSKALGDMYRLHLLASRDGMRFHCAFIPEDYMIAPKELFDRKEMNRLFELGYNQAQAGYPWLTAPPGLVDHRQP